MLNLLSNYFYSYFEDQVFLGTFSWWAHSYNSFGGHLFLNTLLGPYGFRYDIFNTNQPLLWIPLVFGYVIFPQVFFYNTFVAFTYLINFLSSFYFLHRIYRNKYTSILSSFIFAYSPYAVLHSGRHLDLSLLFLIPPFIYVLYKLISSDIEGVKRYSKLLTIIIIAQALISNYYGFFMLLISACFILLWFVTNFKNIHFVRTLKYLLSSLLVSVVILALLLFPYIKANYFSGTSQYNATNDYRIARTFEDFFYFSSRPWYFVLPPVSNPYTGSYTKSILENLIKVKDYFLFHNYFLYEHGGSYLGIVTILLTIFSVLKIKANSNSKLLRFMLGLASIIFLFSMPPYFTIGGLTIYTPNYLLFKFAPMFRATNRLSIFILFILIFINSGILNAFFNRLHKFSGIFLLGLLFLVFIDSRVPVRIINVSIVPEVYTYLRDQTPVSARVAFYPSHQTDIFWLREYKRVLINPTTYNVPEFSSEKFTKSLITDAISTNLNLYNVNYVVVDKSIINEELEFFKHRQELVIDKEFESYIVFRVKEFTK